MDKVPVTMTTVSSTEFSIDYLIGVNTVYERNIDLSKIQKHADACDRIAVGCWAFDTGYCENTVEDPNNDSFVYSLFAPAPAVDVKKFSWLTVGDAETMTHRFRFCIEGYYCNNVDLAFEITVTVNAIDLCLTTPFEFTASKLAELQAGF